MEEDPLKIWQHVHGASVHFPIAMALTALTIQLAPLKFLHNHRDSFVRVAVLIGALVSIPAVLSGFSAAMGWFGIEPWVANRLIPHRNAALCGSALLIILTTLQISVKELPKWVITLLLLASAITMGYAGFMGAYVSRGY